MLLVVVSAHAHAQCERGNQRDLSLHKRLVITCICRCGNRARCRICTCPRTGRRRVNQRDLPTMIVPAVTTMPQNNGPHARTHAPGHAEQPAQVDQVHFISHSWTCEAHQLSHTEGSQLGSAEVEPAALVSVPGGHLFWAMHLSLGQPIDRTSARKYFCVHNGFAEGPCGKRFGQSLRGDRVGTKGRTVNETAMCSL